MIRNFHGPFASCGLVKKSLVKKSGVAGVQELQNETRLSGFHAVKFSTRLAAYSKPASVSATDICILNSCNS